MIINKIKNYNLNKIFNTKTNQLIKYNKVYVIINYVINCILYIVYTILYIKYCILYIVYLNIDLIIK